MSAPFWASLAVLLILLVCVARAEDRPLDVLQRTYEPYVDAADDLAFPLKVKALSSDEYKFWRGAKEFFFRWARKDCADWLNDRAAFVPIHADLHFGNIGTYVSDAGWGKLAFGMVDFDDSCQAPLNIELLQGIITLRLVAEQNKIPLSDAERRSLIATLLDAHNTAACSSQSVADLLAGEAVVTKLMNRRNDYADELAEMTRRDHFRPVVLSGKGKLKDIYRPATQPAATFASAIVEAFAHEPRLAAQFRFTDAVSIEQNILDIAQRIRFGSAGSQGLKKYCVLLRKPLKGVDSDIILYHKQEIPAAAERAEAVPITCLPPGERYCSMQSQLTAPPTLMASWCSLEGQSYFVTLKNSQTAEIEYEQFDDVTSLNTAAKIWGTVEGSAHRRLIDRETLLPELDRRSSDFLREHRKLYRDLRSDPRVQTLVDRANHAIERIASER